MGQCLRSPGFHSALLLTPSRSSSYQSLLEERVSFFQPLLFRCIFLTPTKAMNEGESRLQQGSIAYKEAQERLDFAVLRACRDAKGLAEDAYLSVDGTIDANDLLGGDEEDDEPKPGMKEFLEFEPSIMKERRDSIVSMMTNSLVVGKTKLLWDTANEQVKEVRKMKSVGRWPCVSKVQFNDGMCFAVSEPHDAIVRGALSHFNSKTCQTLRTKEAHYCTAKIAAVFKMGSFL